MFLIVNFLIRHRIWAPFFLLLSSCHLSEKWVQLPTTNRFPMDHATLRPAPQSSRPRWAPVAAVAQVFGRKPARQGSFPQGSMLQIPVANSRSAVQATAFRSADPYSHSHLRPQGFSPSTAQGRVILVNGRAVAPPDAPAVVHRMVAAGNRLQGMPYKWGGGHAKLDDNGYDCSGTVSYVLRDSGLLNGSLTSKGFHSYADSGVGQWVTVWTKQGHVFMTIGGLRLDTGGSSSRTGPRWKTNNRSFSGCVARHPRGL